MIEERFHFGLPEEARKIREEVFTKEQGFPAEIDVDAHDAESWHLVLFYNGVPIATGRAYAIDPETYQLGRIAVLKPYRGKKVGTYLLKFLCFKCRSLGARKVYLDSQLDKTPFYRSCGFREDPSGEVFFEEGVPHIKMGKLLVKGAGLRLFEE